MKFIKYSLLATALASSAIAQPLDEAAIKENFIGTPFSWSHSSGAGGKTIHNADGTMVYDNNGAERSANWRMDGANFCVNANEADEICFVLIANENGFVSEDGSFNYTPE